MANHLPNLSLVIQSATQKTGNASQSAHIAADKLIEWLSLQNLFSVPLELKTGKKETTLSSREEFQNALEHWTEAGFELHIPSHGISAEFSTEPDSFSLIFSVPLSSFGNGDLLASLVTLAGDLFNTLRNQVLIGPVFSIRPIRLDYPRPRPPKHSVIWLLGDAAYFISDDFHHSHPLGDTKGVARLKSSSLNGEVVREISGDLLIIRCKGPAAEGDDFARQRFDLEVWMSRVLELPLHPEFNDLGDRRLPMQRGANASPFTLYDSMRGIAFKAVTADASGKLDDSVKQELSELVHVSKLDDGRKVRSVMIVFPDRDTAIRLAGVVTELGAAGAVYVGDDKRLWDPNPKGNWIPVDWNTAS